MTPKQALWMLIAGSALDPPDLCVQSGLRKRRGVSLPVRGSPGSELLRPSADDGVGRDGGLGAGIRRRRRPGPCGSDSLSFLGARPGCLARMTSRSYGPWAGFLAAFALNVTGYYGLAAATFALPDGPLLFFWLLTIDRLEIALDEPESEAADKLGLGGPGLGRRHAQQVSRGIDPAGDGPVSSCFTADEALVTQAGPVRGVRPGASLVFSPVIVWNAGHGWASFLFQGGRAVGSWTPRPDYLLVAIVAQAGYLFPWIWGSLVLILIAECRNWRRIASDRERLWLCLAVVPLGIFTAVACFRPVLPHWGLIGLVSLFPILGSKWSARLGTRPDATRRVLAACAGFSLVILALPSANTDMAGSSATAEAGGESSIPEPIPHSISTAGTRWPIGLNSSVCSTIPDTFVFTSYWYQSAHLGTCTRPRAARPLLQRRRSARVRLLEPPGRVDRSRWDSGGGR